MIQFRYCISFAFYLLVAHAFAADHHSPFPSTVTGITIPNTHQLSENLYRGMAPNEKIHELVNLGISDILIFKIQTSTEVDEEIKEISTHNITYNNHSSRPISVFHIDFPWHDFSSYQFACEKTIDALRLIRSISESNNRKLFFHCTQGEDQTGYLAALWRMLKFKWNTTKSFYLEMCGHGYESSNPLKPNFVIQELRSDLTPLFSYISMLIEQNYISLGNLNKDFCTDQLPLQKYNMKCSPENISQSFN